MLYEANRRMQLKTGERTPGKLILQKQYTNEGVDEFVSQLKRFLADAGIASHPPVVACIAIAGPVKDNKVTMTNRHWVIDGYELSEKVGIREVRLLNDFVAAGYGLLTLDMDTEVVTLQKGDRKLGAPISCIGSGTGLGKTLLTRPLEGGDYDAWPGEGGHVEFAPHNDLEYELIQWLKKDLNLKRVSVERIVSGSGIVNVYNFLAAKYPDRVDPDVHKVFLEAGDLKGKVIAENAGVDGSICQQVMSIWATQYGSDAGNAALSHIPFGGVFLAGGMTPKNITWLQGEDSPFMKAFHHKGRVSPLLQEIPVYAVMQEDIGQRGSHFVAFRMYLCEEGKIEALSHPVTMTWTGSKVLAATAGGFIAGVIAARFKKA
ncbi:unnamed protein product [Chrysoparadoxa australica]